jgi:cytohesin
MLQYMRENVLTQLFKLRASKCRVKCPDTECQEFYDSMYILNKMRKQERDRFLGVMKDLLLKGPTGVSLPLHKNVVALQELMTLKCPACNATVDPTPDGCSAVMCLNCGGHYCNVCFECFSTGDVEKDRSASHTHAATHATHVELASRSAFLPNHIVEKGQKDLLSSMIIEAVVKKIAGADPETVLDTRHEAAMILMIVEPELNDLGLKAVALWKMIESKLPKALQLTMQITDGVEAGVSSSTPSKRKRSSRAASEEAGSGDAGSGETKLGTRTSARARNAAAAAAAAAESPSRAESGKDTVAGGAKTQSSKQDYNNSTDAAAKQKEAIHGMEVETSFLPAEGSTGVVKKGGAALANAILSDNQMAIKQLMSISEDEFDIDYVDTRHGHPLASLSILTGKYDLALNLLTRGADPLKANTAGRSVLYIAVEAGACELVEVILDMLLLKGIDAVNMVSTTEIQAYRPLHVAARYNYGRVVELLLSRGAELDVREGEHGYTALTLALVLGHEWCSIILVNAGAMVSVKVKSNNGRSPIFVAAEKGLCDVIQLVLNTRPDFKVNDPVVVPSGLKLLHVAAFHKRSHVLQMLLSHGANVNAMDEESKSSPLTMALIGKDISCASTLIDAGADAKFPSKQGRLPMDYAIEHGLGEIVRLFVEKCGVDVNTFTNANEKTIFPLNKAITKGHRHLVPLLVDKGANINGAKRSIAPLITAAQVEDTWSFQYLVDKGASVKAKAPDGSTLMHIAVQKGNCPIVQCLVGNGVDINGSCFGTPYLHLAAKKDSPQIVYKMVNLGANISLKDANGKTALEIATDLVHHNVIDVLIKAANEGAAMLNKGQEEKIVNEKEE